MLIPIGEFYEIEFVNPLDVEDQCRIVTIKDIPDNFSGEDKLNIRVGDTYYVLSPAIQKIKDRYFVNGSFIIAQWKDK